MNQSFIQMTQLLFHNHPYVATVRKNHVKCEVTLIPIYLNLVQINDK